MPFKRLLNSPVPALRRVPAAARMKRGRRRLTQMGAPRSSGFASLAKRLSMLRNPCAGDNNYDLSLSSHTTSD
jgi:hypothetical protein